MKKKYYCWLICALCLLIHFCSGGMSTMGFSMHAPYLREDVGLSNTQISMIGTLRGMVSTLTLPFVNRFFRRFSLRKGLTLMILLMALSFAVIAFCKAPPLFYLLSLSFGIVYAFGTTVPITMLLHNWFDTRRGTAVAVALSGSAVCTVAVPPVVTALVERQGLRFAFLAEAAGVAAVALIVFLLVRDRPEEIGAEPYRGAETKKAGQASARSCGSKGLSRGEMLVLMAGTLLIGGFSTPNSTHYAIHFTTAGYDSGTVAAAISLFGGFLFFGKLLYGWLTDKCSVYYLNYAAFGLWFISLLLIASLNGSAALLCYIAVALQGFGMPIATIGIAVWAENLSTPEQYGQTIKNSQLMFSLGAMLVGPVPGMIADRTGSYAPAYFMFAAMAVAATVLIQYLYIRKRRHCAEASQE